MSDHETATPGPSSQEAKPAPERRSLTKVLVSRRVGPTAILALAALVGLVVWLVVESRSSNTNQPAANPPVAVNLSGLRTLSSASGQSIYWVGPNTQSSLYELTRASNGFYLRYLPSGATAGDKRLLQTVATFPMTNAYDTTKKLATASGTESFEVPGKGIAIFGAKTPTTIYIAYPGTNYQLEIYHPDPATARRLAESGTLQPVLSLKPPPNTNIKGPVAVSPAQLRSLATQLGHPIYWAGPRANTTYELVEASNRFVYVRYLPNGVAAGAKKPYLTVATYPLKDAYKVTLRTSKSSGTVAVKVQGGIGAYSKANPKHVYAAYRGVDAQIEVYDPSPTVPRRIVAAGQVVPVG
jgi:hypothetical protein